MKIFEVLQQKQPTVYVDLDGVLADFDSKFAQYDGDIKKLAASGPDNIYNYYVDLPMLPDGIRLFQYLKGNQVPFRILTAPIRPNPQNKQDRSGTMACARAKLKWIADNLGPRYVSSAIVEPNKFKYATAGGTQNILIDDMTKNTIPWDEHGGQAILHRNYQDTVKRLSNLLDSRPI